MRRGSLIALATLFLAACSTTGIATNTTDAAPPPKSPRASTTTVAQPECPPNYEQAYTLEGKEGRPIATQSELDEPDSSIISLAMVLVGCVQTTGYDEQAPAERWTPECYDPDTATTTTTTTTIQSASTISPLLDYSSFQLIDIQIGCQEVQEMWNHYETGREAMACHIAVDWQLEGQPPYDSSYHTEMTECAEKAFPTYFWRIHGPGPDFISLEQLDQ